MSIFKHYNLPKKGPTSGTRVGLTGTLTGFEAGFYSESPLTRVERVVILRAATCVGTIPGTADGKNYRDVSQIFRFIEYILFEAIDKELYHHRW